MKRKIFSSLAVLLLYSTGALASDSPARWSAEQAKAWYAKQPWLVGSNYNPATASNELEMWQAATFDPKRIDLELGWAESIGMNTMRVFLHDLLWKQDPDGFKKRLDIFLTIASKHHIKPLFVLFDSCWDPTPNLGRQAEPRPGIHNSRWVQSPGAAALDDPAQYPRLEGYVKGVVKAFAKDDRVLGWDLWNEPDNGNGGSYAAGDAKDKTERVLFLLPQVFRWAREAGATQPLTSGVWKGGDWGVSEKLSPMEKVQIENSDVISFHSYEKPDVLVQRVKALETYGRPLICTEYMARGNGSTFAGSLPILQREHVGAINWGLVAGRSQTFLPWDSWEHPYTDREPAIWFHEVFRTNGEPYKQDETDLIRQLTGKQ